MLPIAVDIFVNQSVSRGTQLVISLPHEEILFSLPAPPTPTDQPPFNLTIAGDD